MNSVLTLQDLLKRSQGLTKGPQTMLCEQALGAAKQAALPSRTNTDLEPDNQI